MLILLFCSIELCSTHNTFFSVLENIESGGNTNAVGDNGKSIGPYQIQYVYWYDSKTPGEYKNCFNKAYSERVIKNYMLRYCPEAWKKCDYEVLARTHNGGPSRKGTDKYWAKFQRQFKSGRYKATIEDRSKSSKQTSKKISTVKRGSKKSSKPNSTKSSKKQKRKRK